jgi:hypothetical protein
MELLLMKKSIGSWLMWVIPAMIVIIAVIPALYFLTHIADSEFLDNSMGNWFATMTGVIVGIPIALWLSRRQQKEQEKKEQEAREREALVRKTKILRLVKTELEHNRDQLLASKEEGVTQRVVFVNGLKDELWSAFSDGGELQWIRDLQLLYVISFAYHYIRRVIYLEKIYMEVKHFPGPPSSYPITPGEDLIRGLIDFDPVVLQSIEQALEEIDKSIAALESARKG